MLVATLVVIGQSGESRAAPRRCSSMSLGMGAPLLVVGSSAGRWLPQRRRLDGQRQAGLFGVLMLALAAWMLARIVPARWTLLLFAVPVFAAAIVLWSFVPVAHARRAIHSGERLDAPQAAPPAPARRCGSHAAPRCRWRCTAPLLLIGASRGAEDPLQPLTRPLRRPRSPPSPAISSLADLDARGAGGGRSAHSR